MNQAPEETKRTRALVIVSTIFFMWGFLTCLNDILIPHLKSVFSLTYTESALIQFTFFGAYFIMSLPAGSVVAKIGYKNSISAGLFVAAIGTLLFLPAARVESYPLFLFALFVLASGITLLQVAANPYVVLLGSEETSSSRLNLAQALNSLGTTVAPKIGGLFILSGVVMSADQLAALSMTEQVAYKTQQAQSVQGPYAVLTVILLLLSIGMYLLRLPNLKEEKQGEVKAAATFSDAFKHSNLVLGVIALFLYVGAEVSIGSFLINFMSQADILNVSESVAAGYVPLYWGGALVGRFVGSLLMRKLNAAKMLGVAASVATVLVGCAVMATGPAAAWTLLAVGLFNSIMFPTIFSLGIRGLGFATEKASSLLIMAIVGGAVIPLVQGVIADRMGLQHAFLLPMICYVFISFYGFKEGHRVTRVD
ncbi:L-fucose:H+ symporter permease [Bdellovibrio sp. ZAP7]|uniref:L-fucose:H+ symporter permease n=1 Tax=Bdellovibrio sp. ZAP7 TaxID=2231053 RepID=UPI00115BD5C3|nr:L-fucose:H+ symporter permease [Bdellovibrio sp. ZAP7]QDK45931.1 L-fucose:H+ symporter permease [Bdellovibrio sp. ZAP7]